MCIKNLGTALAKRIEMGIFLVNTKPSKICPSLNTLNTYGGNSYCIVDCIKLIAICQSETEQQIGVEGKPLTFRHSLAEVMACISVGSAPFFYQITAVNFINVLGTAFMHVDP